MRADLAAAADAGRAWSVTPGAIMVSAPISTPASIVAVPGARNVTPASACSVEDAPLRRRLGLHQVGAVLTPIALRTSSVR